MNHKSIAVALAATLFAASTLPAAQPSVLDVKLSSNGAIRGMVVDQAGQAKPDKIVQLVSGTRVVAEVKTDAQGRFLATNLQPGVHVASVDGVRGQGMRLWHANAAPPKSAAGVLLVSEQVVRGQSDTKTYGLPEVIVTAVAIGGVIAIVTASSS
jgi:hypothetical protein